MRDQDRFRALDDECYPRVLAYAVSLVGRSNGEDLTSEVFAIAWRKHDDLPEPPLPWLLGVARNLARETYRRHARQAEVIAELVSDGVSWLDVAGEVAERDQVLQALGTLSDADREVLILLAWTGLSAREAAQVLGCSSSAFFVRLHRARRRLTKALAASHPEPDRPQRAVPALEEE